MRTYWEEWQKSQKEGENFWFNELPQKIRVTWNFNFEYQSVDWINEKLGFLNTLLQKIKTYFYSISSDFLSIVLLFSERCSKKILLISWKCVSEYSNGLQLLYYAHKSTVCFYGNFLIWKIMLDLEKIAPLPPSVITT